MLRPLQDWAHNRDRVNQMFYEPARHREGTRSWKYYAYTPFSIVKPRNVQGFIDMLVERAFGNFDYITRTFPGVYYFRAFKTIGSDNLGGSYREGVMDNVRKFID